MFCFFLPDFFFLILFFFLAWFGLVYFNPAGFVFFISFFFFQAETLKIVPLYFIENKLQKK